MADATDLKSVRVKTLCGFESRHRHPLQCLFTREIGRMCLIPFSVKIEELKIDKELPSKLLAELPGIPHGATGHIVGPNHLASRWRNCVLSR